MRGTYLLGMLLLLFLANLAMLMGMTNWPARVREGFAAKLMNGNGNGNSNGNGNGNSSGVKPVARSGAEAFAMAYRGSGVMEGFQAMGPLAAKKSGTTVEPFMDTLSNGFTTAPIGQYDGLNMAANLPPESQGFRQRMPNVPLAGPPVEIGPDNLFYFKNNECKPECCGATLSCDGGCVCTTPEQRDFVNMRGGNRRHDDGF